MIAKVVAAILIVAGVVWALVVALGASMADRRVRLADVSGPLLISVVLVVLGALIVWGS
jgi:hypothetical protein